MKTVKVFKFGGASVKDVEAIRNVGSILELYPNDKIIVVVSAMGKTTNLLEQLVADFWNNENGKFEILEQFKTFHHSIINDLSLTSQSFLDRVEGLFSEILNKISEKPSDNFHFEYDQIVSYGELLSTMIITEYINENGTSKSARWVDAREIIRTDNVYQEARVNWDKTQSLYDEKLSGALSTEEEIVVTQGFIGRTAEGMTTTLGREGSDFTASIFAYISNAVDVTIWKDVPGMLNADPKYFEGTVLLSKISFTEAVELAYYGASVIHPKTIQPLKKKEIPLYIKSFKNPTQPGTVIQSSTAYDADVPSYIFKEDQVWISVTPKDFSFVVEDQLTEIFSILAKQQIRINLMQNSAVSFSFLIDNKYGLKTLVDRLGEDYLVNYTEGAELLTVRHYDETTIKRLSKNKSILLIQKTDETARVILK